MSLAAYDISMVVVSESVVQLRNRLGTCVIIGFRRKIDENFVFSLLLRNY
jgi:hypothetical protein